MTLKLACADFTFPLLSHDKSLDLIAMLGFEGVDIGLFEGRSPAPLAFTHLRRLEGVGCKALKHTLADHGSRGRGCVFFRPPPIFCVGGSQSSRPVRASPGRAIGFARTVRVCPRVRVPAHNGGLPGVTFETEPEAGFVRAAVVTNWPGRCQTAGSQGVTFSVEAHVGSIVPTPESAARLVQSVPGQH